MLNRQADHRICFIGDSFVQGACDPECRGWVGRVAAAARADGYDVTAYNLGVRRDTSFDILQRWERETAVRFQFDCAKYLVFSFGANDMKIEHGQQRVAKEDSLANFRSIISLAQAQYPVAVIGPVPVGDALQNERILDLCAAYQEETNRLQLPYLPVARTLIDSGIWLQEVAAQDGSHPSAGGYATLAQLILNWPEWWFQPAA